MKRYQRDRDQRNYKKSGNPRYSPHSPKNTYGPNVFNNCTFNCNINSNNIKNYGSNNSTNNTSNNDDRDNHAVTQAFCTCCFSVFNRDALDSKTHVVLDGRNVVHSEGRNLWPSFSSNHAVRMLVEFVIRNSGVFNITIVLPNAFYNNSVASRLYDRFHNDPSVIIILATTKPPDADDAIALLVAEKKYKEGKKVIVVSMDKMNDRYREDFSTLTLEKNSWQFSRDNISNDFHYLPSDEHQKIFCHDVPSPVPSECRCPPKCSYRDTHVNEVQASYTEETIRNRLINELLLLERAKKDELIREMDRKKAEMKELEKNINRKEEEILELEKNLKRKSDNDNLYENFSKKPKFY